MPIVVETSGGTIIRLEQEPLAKGGEGAVHRITSPSNYSSLCAKIYYPKQRNAQKRHKIEYMANNPPPDLVSRNHKVCWAKEVLFQGTKFVGFIMPLAFDGSIQLYELCLTKIKPKYGTLWQRKFDRHTNLGLQARLKLCTNLAAAIHSIHSLQNYVLVDLKPQNVLVTNAGKVSIIDCDSIQISNNGRIIFPARVATAEYIPPEGVDINPSIDLVPPQWDRFSMAIMFYEIIFGLHPYAATFSGQYQHSVTIGSKIKDGLFVHGRNKGYISVLPSLHENFGKIPYSLKQLFVRAFDIGNQMADTRPTAEEWGQTIFRELSNKTIGQQPFSSPNGKAKTKARRKPTPAARNRKTTAGAATVATAQPSNSNYSLFYVILVVAVLSIIGTLIYVNQTAPPSYISPATDSSNLPSTASTAPVVAATSTGEQTIRAFISAEDSREAKLIMSYYDNSPTRYYDLKNSPSKAEILKEYESAWNRVQSSSNDIQSITADGNNFTVETKFTYKTKSTGKRQTDLSKVYIRLRNNKIVNIYHEPIKKDVGSSSVRPSSTSDFVEINAYYRMVENVNLRSLPNESGKIVRRGKEIANIMRSQGKSIGDLSVFVYKRERKKNTVVKGCTGRGDPYWYYVKITFPNAVSDVGWMWGGCLVRIN